MADDFKAMIEALTSKMLNKRLYVVIWRSYDKPELIRRDLEKHLKFMIGLEKRGILFGSGPFTPGEGAKVGDGMSIFRANTIEEARVFANSDPFVLSGARTYDIREWTLMEGRVSMRLDFSDGSFGLD